MDKVLIVDGSVQSTDLISQSLRPAGYEVYTSESGLNALAKAQLFKPDLMIIDVNLPDISGYDLCKRVKNNQETQFVLVLFLSSIETKEMRIRALEIGGDDFMTKNFDAFILLAKVKSLMRVKHLSDQVKQKYTELEEKNNILDRQLKMAQQVQHALIPDINLDFHGVRFFSRYMPALDIGGDFYDVLPINENCISVVMGDVSGHGISAALLTTMLSMMCRTLAARYFNPDQLLFYLNNEFCKIFQNNDSEMYVCVFYAVIDTRKRKIYYSNAGQALPVFASLRDHVAFELDCVGIPIGMMPDSQYDFKTLRYHENDLLLFHTDGLADGFFKENPDNFLEKLKEILLDVKPEDPSYEIVEQVLYSFYNYGASESEKYGMDDVSVVICRM